MPMSKGGPEISFGWTACPGVKGIPGEPDPESNHRAFIRQINPHPRIFFTSETEVLSGKQLALGQTFFGSCLDSHCFGLSREDAL